MHGIWHLSADRNSAAYMPRWSGGALGNAFNAQATAGAPVVSVFNHADQNRVTCASSDATREIRIEVLLSEEKATFEFVFAHFGREQVERATLFEATLRFDLRPIHSLGV